VRFLDICQAAAAQQQQQQQAARAAINAENMPEKPELLPDAAGWAESSSMVVSVKNSCFMGGAVHCTPGVVGGQMELGSKSVLEIDVIFTCMGHVKSAGMKPVLTRSSRVASIFGEILMSHLSAP